VRVCKPLDPEMLADAARHRVVVTAEDGIREGGVGSAIADAVGGSGSLEGAPRVVVLGTPIDYLAHGKPDAILAELGLDAGGLAAAARRVLGATAPTP
jgi:1-deoxy-D-xylulose-5-phosphate synthase